EALLPRAAFIMQYMSFGSQPSASTWIVVWAISKSCSSFFVTARSTFSPLLTLCSSTVMWQLQQITPEPTVQTCRSCTAKTPCTVLIFCSTDQISIPSGIPSSKTLTDSLRMPHELQRISSPIKIETTGSAIDAPVKATTTPAITTPTADTA